MHRFRSLSEELFQVPRGLADAVLVLDESDADEAFTILAEAQAGRYRDARFLDEQLSEFDRSEIAERAGGSGAHANMVAGGGGIDQPARSNVSTRQSRRR